MTEEREVRFCRFPKSLIFAVNDLSHMSHADQLVDLARDVFEKGDAFIQKITGKANRVFSGQLPDLIRQWNESIAA